jgi:hypothetical protein
MRWLFMLVALSGAAHADEWSATDKTLLGAATVLLVIDWGQTRTIAKDERFVEKNKILGPNPSVGDVDKYFAIATLGTIGLAYALPSQYRGYFLGGVVVLESVVVMRNHQLGIKASF